MEIAGIEKIEKMVSRKDLIFKIKKCVYNFQQFKAIRSFAKNVFRGKITSSNAGEDQSNLLVENINFKKRKQNQKSQRKLRKKDAHKNLYVFLTVEQMFLILLKVEYFH